ncbi:pyruvate synthase subunit beta [Candidatus Micrarchaeota archaeon]|nr:pyruvate synthase subunit beta [Candidatus Micrarchaeota archaeon]
MVVFKREDDIFTSGHTACAGCGAALAIRTIMRAIGKDCIVVNTTSCSEIFSVCFPRSAWKVPYIHVTFENGASVASGVSRALKAQGNDHTKVVVIAGDGGTADIGFGAVSGSWERNEDILYIMYNNGAYENTGIQRSSQTPQYAWSTTSQIGEEVRGKQEPIKPMVKIAAAHGIPYAASASTGYLIDLENKVKKALNIKGSRFIDVLSPCVPGWKYDPQLTVELAKLAVETGLWKLNEIENGDINNEKITVQPSFKPVEEYLKLQGRFKHLTPDEIKIIQARVNKDWGR